MHDAVIKCISKIEELYDTRSAMTSIPRVQWRRQVLASDYTGDVKIFRNPIEALFEFPNFWHEPIIFWEYLDACLMAYNKHFLNKWNRKIIESSKKYLCKELYNRTSKKIGYNPSFFLFPSNREIIRTSFSFITGELIIRKQKRPILIKIVSLR